jgi:hypothetical protein
MIKKKLNNRKSRNTQKKKQLFNRKKQTKRQKGGLRKSTCQRALAQLDGEIEGLGGIPQTVKLGLDFSPFITDKTCDDAKKVKLAIINDLKAKRTSAPQESGTNYTTNEGLYTISVDPKNEHKYYLVANLNGSKVSSPYLLASETDSNGYILPVQVNKQISSNSNSNSNSNNISIETENCSLDLKRKDDYCEQIAILKDLIGISLRDEEKFTLPSYTKLKEIITFIGKQNDALYKLDNADFKRIFSIPEDEKNPIKAKAVKIDMIRSYLYQLYKMKYKYFTLPNDDLLPTGSNKAKVISLKSLVDLMKQITSSVQHLLTSLLTALKLPTKLSSSINDKEAFHKFYFLTREVKALQQIEGITKEQTAEYLSLLYMIIFEKPIEIPSQYLPSNNININLQTIQENIKSLTQMLNSGQEGNMAV